MPASRIDVIVLVVVLLAFSLCGINDEINSLNREIRFVLHLNEICLLGDKLRHTVSLRTNLKIYSTRFAGVDSSHSSKCLTTRTCKASISLNTRDNQ